MGDMQWTAHGEHEVPAGTGWLSPREQAILRGIRLTKRHREYRTRRWAGKRALAAVLGRDPRPEALAAIEILNEPAGAPYAAVDGCPAGVEISLSDRGGWAVCLVGPPGAGGSPVGIDLELVEPRSEGFVDDFLTPAERDAVQALPPGDARDAAANLVWSAKESVLKVRKVGLRADTRDVQVDCEPAPSRADGWARLVATARDGAAYPGWWRREGRFLLTLAFAVEGPPPARLEGSGDLSTAVPAESWRTRPRP
jgi:4'-phosphopantetheinyl transferase